MKTTKQNIYAVLAAFIWGSAFVAQDKCAEYLGPFTVNALRGIIAFLFLAVLIAVCKKKGFISKPSNPKKYKKRLYIGGIICGLTLALSSNLQQAGISDTGPGKAAFITAMYMVIVPVLGLFFKRKVGINVWAAVAISVVGFYFLCLYGESFNFAAGDLIMLMCAFGNAVHILSIDCYSDINGIELSCVQFAVVAVVSTICMFVFETPEISSIVKCILPILYVAVFSSGVAYTLEIIALKGTNPTVITLLFSLESVFAVLTERILPGASKSPLTWWETIGYVLIFAAVVITQIPMKKKKGL